MWKTFWYLGGMRIFIPIRALSVNEAWKGQRFKTKKYRKFETDFCRVVSRNGHEPEAGELFVRYIFYIKNYASADVDNLIKQTNDMLCKLGYIKDDRYVKSILCVKERVKDIMDEKIITDIVLYDKRHDLLNVL